MWSGLSGIGRVLGNVFFSRFGQRSVNPFGGCQDDTRDAGAAGGLQDRQRRVGRNVVGKQGTFKKTVHICFGGDQVHDVAAFEHLRHPVDVPRIAPDKCAFLAVMRRLEIIDHVPHAPCSSNASTTWDPINPDPPATTIFILTLDFGESHVSAILLCNVRAER